MDSRGIANVKFHLSGTGVALNEYERLEASSLSTYYKVTFFSYSEALVFFGMALDFSRFECFCIKTSNMEVDRVTTLDQCGSFFGIGR